MSIPSRPVKTLDTENPVCELLTARPYIEDYLSDQSFNEVRRMLHCCANEHNSCTKLRPHPLPARVLDLSDPVRLVSTNGQIGKYAALSYCWGMAVQPLVTIGATISTLMQSVPMDDLPQTLKDAITVARKLGICYLWADVLCIIQDDSADKTEQISKIPSIFTNSHVTICAASAVSCTSGFLNRSPDDFEPFELPFRCPGSTGKAGALIFQWAPFDYYGFDPIYRRAWTLEERILSPRVLCYTSSGIFWQCQSGHYLIGQGVRAPDGDVIIGGRPSYTERLENTFFQKEIESLPGKESLEVLLKLWSDLVHDYSARSVTDHKDRLRAISGLAARFQTLFSDTYTYKAGLWHGSSEGHVGKSLLLSQLLWRESSGPLRNPRDDKIPTWSWASAQNFINWDLLTGITAAPLRDVPGSVIDCTVHPLSLKNPFGQVDSGSVMLQGVLRTASIANPRLYLGNDTYLTTYLDPSNNASTRAAEGVSFLLLLHSHGLVLRKTDQGSMRRIGVFYIHWDTDWDTNRSTQDDLAYRKSRRNIRALVEPGVKAFFGEGTGSVVATVTII